MLGHRKHFTIEDIKVTSIPWTDPVRLPPVESSRFPHGIQPSEDASHRQVPGKKSYLMNHFKSLVSVSEI